MAQVEPATGAGGSTGCAIVGTGLGAGNDEINCSAISVLIAESSVP